MTNTIISIKSNKNTVYITGAMLRLPIHWRFTCQLHSDSVVRIQVQVEISYLCFDDVPTSQGHVPGDDVPPGHGDEGGERGVQGAAAVVYH